MPISETARLIFNESVRRRRAEREVLRSEADIKEGCLQCGALAVWTDSPQVADYWYLPCGHPEDKLGAVVVTRTAVAT